MLPRSIFAAIPLALAVAACHAAPSQDAAIAQDVAKVKQTLSTHLGNRATIDEVRASALPGIFEVRMGQDIVYADRSGRYVITGDMIDTQSGTNLTLERRAALEAISWQDLPLNQAIKSVKGKGTRVMAVFADPNCGYCKRLEQELQKLDDVTVYTFVYPFLSADSSAKASGILCAKDPAKAWHAWMVDNQAPAATKACATQTDALVALGRRLNVRGTPVVIFGDGSRLRGYAAADVLEKKLATIKR